MAQRWYDLVRVDGVLLAEYLAKKEQISLPIEESPLSVKGLSEDDEEVISSLTSQAVFSQRHYTPLRREWFYLTSTNEQNPEEGDCLEERSHL